jgi:hypothetical protein
MIINLVNADDEAESELEEAKNIQKKLSKTYFSMEKHQVLDAGLLMSPGAFAYKEISEIFHIPSSQRL